MPSQPHFTELQFDAADLNRRLDVRVIRNIAHNLRRVRGERLLKVSDRMEEEVSQGKIRGRRARRHPTDSFIHFNLDQRGAEKLLDQGNVFCAVVRHIEMRILLLGIHHAHFNHRMCRSRMPLVQKAMCADSKSTGTLSSITRRWPSNSRSVGLPDSVYMETCLAHARWEIPASPISILLLAFSLQRRGRM